MKGTLTYKTAVIGLGYVGLPLSGLLLSKGHRVYGIEADSKKIERLGIRQSYLSDFSNREIKQMFESGRFSVGSSFDAVTHADTIVLCVPTPLSDDDKPELRYVLNAIKQCMPYLRNGHLLVLESSTYPGTTEEVLLPLVESTGLKVGRDIFLAYSPERIDPGNRQFTLQQIPKVVGGVTAACTDYASRVYGSAFDRVVVVSSPKVAEMTKILENCQRLVNISFMNEMLMLADRMKIDLWEAIEAAGTKPYGFTPYYPGPGVGGHCIPVDPLFMLWKAKQHNFDLQFIDIANRINKQMPVYVAEKVGSLLSNSKRLDECSVFVLGVTYKKDVNDMRESSALTIMKLLQEQGIRLSFYDPFIKEIHTGDLHLKRLSLTKRYVKQHDCTLILTDHSQVPYDSVVAHAPFVIDTRHVTANLGYRENVVFL